MVRPCPRPDSLPHIRTRAATTAAVLAAPPSQDCYRVPSSRVDFAAASAAPHPANRLAPSPLELCTPASDSSRCPAPS